MSSHSQECLTLEEVVASVYGTDYDLHAILGLQPQSSQVDIAHAYTIKSIEMIPDPDIEQSPEELLELEMKHNALKAAFTILSNGNSKFVDDWPQSDEEAKPGDQWISSLFQSHEPEFYKSRQAVQDGNEKLLEKHGEGCSCFLSETLLNFFSDNTSEESFSS